MWALKKLNLDWGTASSQKMNEMNEFDEFRLKSYESSAMYNEKMKNYHDQKIKKREFARSDLVLLFNSRLACFLENSRKSGPGHSMLLNYFHMELLNSRTMKEQGSR